MAGIIVNPRARIFHGHEWVYSSEIKKTFGNPEAGDVITLKDFKDRPLGSAIYNPASQIVARRFSRRRQDLDADFFARRLARAIDFRKSLDVDPHLCRLVWSESDGLPGVVVDRYGDVLSLQTLTLAMDRRKKLIAEVLAEITGVRCVVERNESPVRKAEGLEPESGVLVGDPPGVEEIDSKGIPLEADVTGGQKTGLYLDQLDNYLKVAPLAKGRRVLDAFCNQGGFALSCALAGAASVTGIDASAPAIAAAQRNAARAGVAIDWVCGNAFDFLKSTSAATEAEEDDQRSPTFDLIILDPPSFARSKRTLADAIRGYKEIHLRSLKILRPGGILVTFSCSHHFGATELREVANSAAVDARRTLRQITSFQQRPDHPILLGIPETSYLHGFAFEVIASW